MPLRSGSHTIDSGQGTLLIDTARAGAAARVGHDLTLAATSWNATVVVDARAPSRSRVSATVDARSLEVVKSTGGVAPLSDAQKAEILRTTAQSVLRSARHPTITFTSTSVTARSGGAVVEGDLTIAGRTRPATVTVSVRGGSGGTASVTAKASIDQTDFGIKPYSALLGALRVADVVVVTVKLRLPSA